MIEKLIGAIIPGVRDARPPLLAGMSWALAFVTLYFDELDRFFRDSRAGHSIVEIAGSIGTAWALLILSILLFMAGILLLPIAKGCANLVARILNAFRMTWDLGRQIRSGVARLQEEVDSTESKLQSLRIAQESNDTANGDLASQIKRGEDRLALLKARSETAKGAGSQPWKWKRPAVQKALGLSDGDPLHAEAARHLKRVARATMEEWISKTGTAVDDMAAQSLPLMAARESIATYKSDLENGALDVLRAHDSQAYLDLDREHVEAETRLAVSLPAVVVGVVLAIRSELWGVPAAIVGLTLFAQSAIRRSDENLRIARVLNEGDRPVSAVREVQADTLRRLRDETFERALEREAVARHLDLK